MILHSVHYVPNGFPNGFKITTRFYFYDDIYIIFLAPAGWGAPWCYHGGAKNTPDADSACRKRRLKEQKVWGSRNEPRELKSDMLGEKRSLTDHSMTQNHKYDFTD